MSSEEGSDRCASRGACHDLSVLVLVLVLRDDRAAWRDMIVLGGDGNPFKKVA